VSAEPNPRALERWENEGGALPLPHYHADFPGLANADGSRWHYLDTAATSQKPQVVIDAVARALGADYATVHRGVYTRSAEMTLGYEAARRRVAAFIGGKEDEIVFTRGATEAINLVAQSWGDSDLKSGDRILLSMLEHHSNIVPWQLLRDRVGIEIDVCPLTRDGRIDLDAAEGMLTPAHKLVAFAHVSNVLGSVLDARRAADLAHAVGAKLLLDGCQAVPRLPVDVVALDCDFYVFSAHKLYGPTAIGALWARSAILAGMPPWQGGGAMIDRVTFEKTTYAPAPQRFEAGTPAIVEAIGLAAAIDYVAGIGLEAIRAHEVALVRHAREALRRINSLTLFGPEESAGIVSFALEGVHPHDLGTILDEENVAIRAGHHCAQPLMDHLGVPATARASFGLYSDESDIDALVRGIERTMRIFG
jgi:cysteine desulfurase/selenocysteine lyase